ncbi:hypothetical protein [Mucilaginibacter antarcticus]|uniref:hypothetical protein n=1 Tax=Mucilaginibacter antarcticus TaxID=1855725 RepID=UPI00363F259D
MGGVSSVDETNGANSSSGAKAGTLAAVKRWRTSMHGVAEVEAVLEIRFILPIFWAKRDFEETITHKPNRRLIFKIFMIFNYLNGNFTVFL